MEMRFSSGLADRISPPTTTSRGKNSKAGARIVFRAEILRLQCKTKSYISPNLRSGAQAGTSPSHWAFMRMSCLGGAELQPCVSRRPLLQPVDREPG